MTQDEVKAKVRKLIDGVPISTLMTVDTDGGPAGRPMQTARVDDDFTVWFATYKASHKIGEIGAAERVGVMWYRASETIAQNAYAQVRGTAVILDDQAIKDELWRDSWQKHFPGGKTDPDYVVIKVTPRKLDFFSMETGPVQTVEL